jgi:hypothetical protein
MRKLAELIDNELRTQEICALYDAQLARIWPRGLSLAKRKQQIKRFAREHEFAVTFYDVGLCAIFEKAHSPAKTVKRMLLLEGEQVNRRKHR